MNLKQQITLGLCAFYLISVIGVALSLHFCGGKLASVHLTEVARCGTCKMTKKASAENNCCKNTAVDAKIKDSHQSGLKVDLPKNYSIQLFIAPFISGLIKGVIPKLFSKAENKAPPLSAKLPLYAYNCVFRN